MRLPNAPLRRTRPIQEHGRNIFAYCHVHNNQVLYSFTPVLHNASVLKQLPDAGANNNPPKLRKDLWRPLWSVTLPEGKDGLAQGLHAFHKLREYRKLHELCWEVPPELARPTTQKEMDEIKEKLDDRGGSKKEKTHDIIKRNKKKIRQRMVMDQKANSIADLAAVLLEQDQLGADRASEQEKERLADRNEEVAKMLTLAEEARHGGLIKIEEQLAELERRKEAKKEGAEEETSNRQMRYETHKLQRQRRKMRFAANAVMAADEGRTMLVGQEVSHISPATLDVLGRELQRRQGGVPAEESKVEEQSVVEDVEAEEELLEEEANEIALEDEVVDLEPTSSPKVPLDHRASILEQSMIKDVHRQPHRVDKALKAYTPNEADINELRTLAKGLEQVLRKTLERSEASLGILEDAQAKVDREEPEAADYGEHSNLRRARIARKTAVTNMLAEAVRALDGESDLAIAEAKNRDHLATPGEYHRIVDVQPEDRWIGGRITYLNEPRAYAAIIAKARLEARADELAMRLESGQIEEPAMKESEAVVAEDAVAEAEVEAQEEIEDQVENEAAEEEVLEPTETNLLQAAKVMRIVNRRIETKTNIAAYRSTVEQLSRGEQPEIELVQAWADLDVEAKMAAYRKRLDKLERQASAWEDAKLLLESDRRVGKLELAAQVARQRAHAARTVGDREEPLTQRSRAEVFEAVAALRRAEDLLSRASDEMLESMIAENAPVGESAAKTAAAEDGDVQGEEKESSFQGNENTYTSTTSDPQATNLTQNTREKPPTDYHALLPSFPEITTLPARGPLRAKLRRLRAPSFTATGVSVMWHNILDAEFAAKWPENVEHLAMGFTRYTAPKATDEGIYDVEAFKNQEGGGYKGKKWERENGAKGVDARVQGILGKVMQGIKAEGGRVHQRERRAERKEAVAEA